MEINNTTLYFSLFLIIVVGGYWFKAIWIGVFFFLFIYAYDYSKRRGHWKFWQ